MRRVRNSLSFGQSLTIMRPAMVECLREMMHDHR